MQPSANAFVCLRHDAEAVLPQNAAGLAATGADFTPSPRAAQAEAADSPETLSLLVPCGHVGNGVFPHAETLGEKGAAAILTAGDKTFLTALTIETELPDSFHGAEYEGKKGVSLLTDFSHNLRLIAAAAIFVFFAASAGAGIIAAHLGLRTAERLGAQLVAMGIVNPPVLALREIRVLAELHGGSVHGVVSVEVDQIVIDAVLAGGISGFTTLSLTQFTSRLCSSSFSALKSLSRSEGSVVSTRYW